MKRFAIRVLFLAGLLAVLLGPAATSAWSRQVQVSYSAEVVTVTGTPFGLTNPRGKVVTGYFWYETATRDTEPDLTRGIYDHALPFSGFLGQLEGTIFTGSRTPQVVVENIGTTDTFRFIDGVDSAHPLRAMSVNGASSSAAQLFFAITSANNILNADGLPNPFPFAATDPHTFSLGDKNGQMLLQFKTMKDAAPPASGMVSVKVSVSDPRARFLVDGGLYTEAKTFQWPAGSTHLVDFPLSDDERQYSQLRNSRWKFGGWSEKSGLLDLSGANSATIVAAAGVEVVGSVGSFEHMFHMNFFGTAVDLTTASPQETPYCPSGTNNTSSPDSLRSGRVIMDGTCYWGSFRDWVSEGEHTFNAFPYPGFAFVGWLGGSNRTAQARTERIEFPTVFETRFEPARRVRFLTEPSGLSVTINDVTVTPVEDLCQSLTVGTPATIKPPCPGEFDFGPNSAHAISAVSPQRDRYGKSWIFEDFSNGMSNRSTYTVGLVTSNDNFDTLVARFVPGISSVISSKPIGVPISVNSRTLTSEYAVFKPGEEIALSAPATATIAGRKYTFVGWSDGGAREHTATVPKDAADSFNLLAEYSIESQILVDSATPNAAILVDGQSCALPCPINGPDGREVRIEPAPSASLSPLQRMEFLRWSDGASRQRIEKLAGQEARLLTAIFNNSYLLETGTDPGDGAVFTTNPSSADGFFPEGTSVQISVESKGGFLFRRWSGDASGTEQAITVHLDGPRRTIALLERVPFLADNPVRNAATNLPGPVAPGSVVSIVGESLAYEFVQGPDNPLSQAIYGTSAAVDYYRFLPLKFVSPRAIQAVLPSDLTPGEHVISVRRVGYTEIVGKFVVAGVGPGIFQTSEDTPTVLGRHADGRAITASDPAHPGEQIRVLGTGFGPYRIPAAEGLPLPEAPAYPLSSEIDVFLAGAKLTETAAAGEPGQTGVASVNFQVPAATPAGAIELKVRVEGQESPAVILPVSANPETETKGN